MITHAKILAALAELRTTAEAAAEDEARGVGTGAGTSALHEHGQNWSPAHSLRWLSWAEQVAARHHPAVGLTSTEVVCWWCSPRAKDWPCPDLAGLAGALGLEET